jgi:hypothetical protein
MISRSREVMPADGRGWMFVINISAIVADVDSSHPREIDSRLGRLGHVSLGWSTSDGFSREKQSADY